MQKNYLQNFRTLDKEIFFKFMRNLGFATSAIYRLKHDYFVLIVKASDEEKWPAVVKSFDHYTPDGGQIMHPGWLGSEFRNFLGPSWFKEWPKATHFYLPDQELDIDRYMFTATCAPGKRIKGGELSGPLEALANRLRSIHREHGCMNLISETTIQVFLKSLGLDIHNLMDHELRTPLASISGYLSYVRELQDLQQNQEASHYLKIIEAETKIALEAVERLSISFGNSHINEPCLLIDLSSEIQSISEKAQVRTAEIVGENHSHMIGIHFKKFIDGKCEILAQEESLRWAIWEVLKNAMVFSRSGQIQLNLYMGDRMVVLDIEDDGPGVPSGSEELIFMQFYQDLRHAQIRRGKRGLGLGLFLARKIMEKQLGQLTYLRHKSRSIFRFIWPSVVPQLDHREDRSLFNPAKSQ